MKTLPPCKGFLGYVFGHRFEPRYTRMPYSVVTSPEEFAMKKITDIVQEYKNNEEADSTKFRLAISGLASIRAITKRNVIGIYTRDICIHCGVVVENMLQTTSNERRLDTEL